MLEEPWYQSLREQWKPSHVRLLLIGESAPDANADPEARRFFYAPTLSGADNLFRGVVQALYGEVTLAKSDDRTLWLNKLKADGVYLIDLVPYPVNKLPAAARKRAWRDNALLTVTAAKDLTPDGVIICHAPTFKVLSSPLREAGLPVLHTEPIPFPLGNFRAKFVEMFRAALQRKG